MIEGRFDSEASSADPGDSSCNGADAFDRIEKQVECFAGTQWDEGNVLPVQMYGQANRATSVFASTGIFPDSSVDSGLQGFEPRRTSFWLGARIVEFGLLSPLGTRKVLALNDYKRIEMP